MGSLMMASARLAGRGCQNAIATGRASEMLMAPLALRPSLAEMQPEVLAELGGRFQRDAALAAKKAVQDRLRYA